MRNFRFFVDFHGQSSRFSTADKYGRLEVLQVAKAAGTLQDRPDPADQPLRHHARYPVLAEAASWPSATLEFFCRLFAVYMR